MARAILLVLMGLIFSLVLHLAPARSLDTAALLQQGLEQYQADRFTAAIQLYQQAIATQQQDPLSEALTQRYLALAYQELGQWQSAKTAIDLSLALLKTITPQDKTYFEVLAKVLNTQGRHQFQTGQVELALETWKQATVNYQKAEQISGVTSSLINQAIALQSLGFSVQAQTTLTAAYQTLQQSDQAALKVEGLLQFGDLFRRLGALNRSMRVLQTGLNTTQDAATRSKFLLELGNTERAIATRSFALGKDAEATQQVQAALQDYQRSLQLATSDAVKLQAQLNILSLLVESNQAAEAMQHWQLVRPLLSRLIASRTNVYAQLNAAQTLIDLRKRSSALNVSEIADLITQAYQQAKTLQDPRTESYALGELGELYESTQQWSEARQVTAQALLRIEGLQTPDLRYRWEWQQGRLLKQQGDRAQAIAAYTRSITALQMVRKNLLLVNPDVQFSFRDRVEPIYRGLTDLLLQPGTTAAATQAQLQSAIANIDSLQLAELENFLRCDLSQRADSPRLEQQDSHAAFIYPIILPDRIEVIAQLPGQPIQHYSTAIDQASVTQTLEDLRRSILRGNASRVIAGAKQVYSWLVEPLESDLNQNQAIATLVFVLDGELRNIPMTVLYDGKTDQYLVEKQYAIALLPSSQLFDLQVQSASGKVLGAGISQQLQVGNRRFNALNASAELAEIEALKNSEILLNANFTQSKLQEKLRSQFFSIVHLVTHGRFSSDPAETYLLIHSATGTTGELLNPDDFNLLLQTPNVATSARAIDLLVLSACETAEGDNRAALGLVGLAIRAGARSTLGTLWQVNDASTIALMRQFYQALQQPGISKAQALHQAQVALLRDVRYQNPYHWSPYVLVGSWR